MAPLPLHRASCRGEVANSHCSQDRKRKRREREKKREKPCNWFSLSRGMPTLWIEMDTGSSSHIRQSATSCSMSAVFYTCRFLQTLYTSIEPSCVLILWEIRSSGMWRRVVGLVLHDVSNDHSKFKIFDGLVVPWICQPHMDQRAELNEVENFPFFSGISLFEGSLHFIEISNTDNLYLNLLKPTGHVMHQQFSIQQLHVLPTLYLCVLYLSENKQLLLPLTA